MKASVPNIIDAKKYIDKLKKRADKKRAELKKNKHRSTQKKK